MEQEQNAGNFQNLLSLPDKPVQHFIKTVDATGFVSVLYPIDSNHIRIGFGRIASKRYREIMKGCIFAALLLWETVFHFICGS